jgi:hypothetical protein
LLNFPEENVSDLRAALIVETARLSINNNHGPTERQRIGNHIDAAMICDSSRYATLTREPLE